MMTDAELRKLIKDEIKQQINIILNAETSDNTSQTESINALFPGMPVIENRPVMHPYGFVSRAPEGTISVVAKTGDHPGNRMVLGHRDKNRPTVQSGETMLYNEFGDKIYVSQGIIRATTPKWITEADSIFIGSESADEPFVLGKVFKNYFAEPLLDQLRVETHISGIPGYPTSIPQNAAQYAQIEASPIMDEKILSDKIFGEKG
jgi:hypothetical protein